MSALYVMSYRGIPGVEGHGVLYIGQGIILGVDVTKIRYKGTYTRRGQYLDLDGTATARDDAPLVTGDILPAGQSVPITARLPEDFVDGSHHRVSVGGHDVYVAFEKVGEIPN